MEEESADKGTAVLVVAAEDFGGKLQAAPVDVGCALVPTAGETVPAAAAARGAAEDPEWILGS